jgi:hypothetical protein
VAPSAQVATSQQQPGLGQAQAPAAGSGLTAGGTAAGSTSMGAGATAGAASTSQNALGITPGGAAAAGPGAASGTDPQSAPQSKAAAAHGPVSVGFVVSDFTKTAAAFGFGAVSDPQRYFKQLVAYSNAHGGLAGRQIKPVYSSIDGGSSDYSTASQAACAALTEDNHVELVASNLWVNQTLTGCLLKAGVPQFEGTSLVNNTKQMLSQYPNLFVPAGLATDREIATRITESVRLGWLTKKDKLGIVYDGCAYDTHAVQEAAVPTARRFGIPVDTVQAADCGVGFSDVGKFSSGMQTAEFRMHSDGVTKVMFLTQGEGGALVFFSNDAETQAWHPTYIDSSNALISSAESQGEINSGQRPYIRGIGTYPTVDDAKAPVTPQMKACLQHVLAGGGSTPPNVNEWLTMYGACNAFSTAEAALTRSGGAGRLAALRPAVEGLGRSFVSVTSLGGKTLFGPGRHDGAGAVAPFAYKKSCDCFGYVGPPREVS